MRNRNKHTKARQRRHLTAPERLARDRRQAQHAAEALRLALDDLGLPDNLVTEIARRLGSQQKLLGKIVGVRCIASLGPQAARPGSYSACPRPTAHKSPLDDWPLLY